MKKCRINLIINLIQYKIDKTELNIINISDIESEYNDMAIWLYYVIYLVIIFIRNWL